MISHYQVLQNKNIAVVGLSDKPTRASHRVAKYLQAQGYTIIPINPALDKVLGEKAYPSVTAVPKEIEIDVVDIFRKPKAVIGVIKDVIESQRQPIIWLQEGVSSPEAEDFIQKNGFESVSHVCMMKEHQKSQISA